VEIRGRDSLLRGAIDLVGGVASSGAEEAAYRELTAPDPWVRPEARTA
jgi:hypothetical protein